MNMWRSIKGYVAGAVAFITCPCHLPLTIPLLIALTAGTAFSRWLATNSLLFGAMVAGVFVLSLGLALQWWGKDGSVRTDRHAGWRKVTLLTSSSCKVTCREARATWRAAQERMGFTFEEVDIHSPRGRDLAARHNIFTTPVAVADGAQVIRGDPGPVAKADRSATRNGKEPDR